MSQQKENFHFIKQNMGIKGKKWEEVHNAIITFLSNEHVLDYPYVEKQLFLTCGDHPSSITCEFTEEKSQGAQTEVHQFLMKEAITLND